LVKKCSLSEKCRKINVVCSLIVFALMAIVMAVDCIVYMDDDDIRHLPEVEHIRDLKLPEYESINPLNLYDHDDE
jgi:hypothetical protein